MQRKSVVILNVKTMTDILEKVRRLRLERNWSEYQLAEYAGIPQSTISSWFRKHQIPTIPSLEKICAAFGMTLAQFFTDEAVYANYLTENQRQLLHSFNRLRKEQQDAVLNLLETL